MEMDPMDFPAALIYIGLNAVMAIVPLAVFYGVFYKSVKADSAMGMNGMFKASEYMLWIGNLIVYGIPAIFGGFTWLWNAYIVAGYVAWTQYIVVWGGLGLQGINFFLLIAGAATFESNYSWSMLSQDLSPEVGMGGGKKNTYATSTDAWVNMSVWMLVTGGVYAGYWLLNDNFLSYYVIEEIIHKIPAENRLNGEVSDSDGEMSDSDEPHFLDEHDDDKHALSMDSWAD
jgi:hypothetical protein